MRELDPVTPGELLSEEFLKPMGLSQHHLDKEIGVPPQQISEIVAGQRAITADTDLRLCRFLGLSDGYWLRAQAAYNAEVAQAVWRGGCEDTSTLTCIKLSLTVNKTTIQRSPRLTCSGQCCALC